VKSTPRRCVTPGNGPYSVGLVVAGRERPLLRSPYARNGSFTLNRSPVLSGGSTIQQRPLTRAVRHSAAATTRFSALPGACIQGPFCDISFDPLWSLPPLAASPYRTATNILPIVDLPQDAPCVASPECQLGGFCPIASATISDRRAAYLRRLVDGIDQTHRNLSVPRDACVVALTEEVLRRTE
jgi:hypothetical protein